MRTKRKSEKIKYIIIYSLAFLLSVGTLVSIVKNSYELYRLNSYKKKLIKEKVELEKKIEEADSKEFIEYNARVKLGLKKKNEIEYRFNPPE